MSKHKGHKPPPPARNIYLSFQGVAFSSGARQRFDVVCGANPPTITGGYGIWQPFKRYLQRSLTIFQGYDPAQMTVDIIFGSWIDGWQDDDATGAAVETDIGKLEWMGGLTQRTGPSPVVYVYSHSNQGGDSNLVPPQVRGLPWIITTDGLQWGTAYRNANGYRIWQEATIQLENYLNLNAPPQPDTSMKGGYFTSRAGRDTALKIAGAPSANSPIVDHTILARRILSDPKNNPMKGTSIRLERKSISWQIRHGVKVWVPAHQIL